MSDMSDFWWNETSEKRYIHLFGRICVNQRRMEALASVISKTLTKITSQSSILVKIFKGRYFAKIFKGCYFAIFAKITFLQSGKVYRPS